MRISQPFVVGLSIIAFAGCGPRDRPESDELLTGEFFGFETPRSQDPAFEGTPVEPVEPLSEDACLTLDRNNSQLLAVDIESGRVDTLGPTGIEGSTGVGLARFSDEVLFCSDFDKVHALDLETFAVRTVRLDCDSLAAWGERPVVLDWFGVTVFDSVKDLFDGASGDRLDFDPFASRIQVDGDTLYASWHATDEFERFDLVNQTRLSSLIVPRDERLVMGFDIVDEQLVVVPDANETEFERYKVPTGEPSRATFAEFETAFSGLACP